MAGWILLLVPSVALAQAGDGPIPRPRPKYPVEIERSVMMPMRDGVRLSTDLYRPAGVVVACRWC